MTESTQLERLARPFPPKYVRPPAKGKYGDYVPHHVVTQAALAILGPFDLHVGEVFTGENGHIEGCLVTVSTRVDGVPVSITEVGDCEQPGNWKTQGARMKDAISDGVKRCFARLGLGLHLYSGADFFLYEQLRQENAGDGQIGPTHEGGAPSSLGPPDRTGSPATSPAVEAGEHPAAANGSEPSSPIETPTQPSKARREKLKAKCVALQADGVSIADEREQRGLPLVDSCDEEQLRAFEAMVFALEVALEKPFEQVTA